MLIIWSALGCAKRVSLHFLTSAFLGSGRHESARAVAVVLQVSVGQPCDEGRDDSMYSSNYASVQCSTPAGRPAQSAGSPLEGAPLHSAALMNEVEGLTQVPLPSVALIISNV